jgi:hypothetical protein
MKVGKKKNVPRKGENNKEEKTKDLQDLNAVQYDGLDPETEKKAISGKTDEVPLQSWLGTKAMLGSVDLLAMSNVHSLLREGYVASLCYLHKSKIVSK